MVRKAKKAVKRKNVKKPAKVEKYDSGYIERVEKLIERLPLNRTGGIAFGVIAKGIGVSARTMLKWRTVDSGLYKPDFVAAIDESEKKLRKRIAMGLESVQLGKIHAGVIKKAQGYKRKKVIKEPVMVGPDHPPYSRFTKEDLVTYAMNTMRFKVSVKLSKGAIENAIRKRIALLTVEVLKIVRVEEEFVPSDVVAAKYADQNMGKTEEQWTDIQKLDVESKSLADILAKTGIV